MAWEPKCKNCGRDESQHYLGYSSLRWCRVGTGSMSTFVPEVRPERYKENLVSAPDPSSWVVQIHLTGIGWQDDVRYPSVFKTKRRAENRAKRREATSIFGRKFRAWPKF